MLVAGQPPPGLQLQIQEETLAKFERFVELFRKHEKDRGRAWDVLKGEFGNTYWFFDVFGRSASAGRPPGLKQK